MKHTFICSNQVLKFEKNSLVTKNLQAITEIELNTVKQRFIPQSLGFKNPFEFQR